MKLFNNKIEKNCSYCQKKNNCKKYGEPCNGFVYNPLERIPFKNPKLKEYSKDEFKL